MEIALDEAGEALSEGNPPIAAVLIDHDSGILWGGKTVDKTEGHLMRHAELRVYDLAQPVLNDNLENCTLVSTSQLCSSCTPHYAEGRIGKIIIGAQREMVYPLTGIMRPRKINMPELIEDGNTDTLVIENFMALRSLQLFVKYGRLNKHELPEDTDAHLRQIANKSGAEI